jgi:hypothetical protein
MGSLEYEELREDMMRSGPRWIYRKLGFPQGDLEAIYACIAKSFTQKAVSGWARFDEMCAHGKPLSCINIRNTDSICWRCRAAKENRQACPWASRLQERDDWVARKIGDEVRVCECPGFELDRSGFKDFDFAAMVATAMYRDDGLTAYVQSLPYGKQKKWVACYNKVLRTLGADAGEIIQARKVKERN